MGNALFFVFLLLSPFEENIFVNDNINLYSPCHDGLYYAVENGCVDSVDYFGEGFSVTIKTKDEYAITYTGLSDVFVKVGDSIEKDQKIGFDSTITDNTEFIAYAYRTPLNCYSPLNNNKIVFPIPNNTPLFPHFSGCVKNAGYDSEKGNFINIDTEGININFSNLKAVLTTNGEVINSECCIGYTGMTGACILPQVEITFTSLSQSETDFRIIYIQMP